MHAFALPKLRPGRKPFGLRAAGFLGAEQVGEAEAEQPQAAGDEHVAARQAVAEALRRSENAQHQQSPSRGGTTRSIVARIGGG